MRIKLFLAMVLLCSLSLSAQIRGVKKLTPIKPTNASFAVGNVNQLPIRRVVLYSNGVSYIERRGVVSGNAEVNLRLSSRRWTMF